MRRGSASPPRARRACSDGSIPASATTRPSTFEIAFCATTTTSPSSSADALDDRAGEVVSLAQLGQSLDGRDGEAAHSSGQPRDADPGVALVALVEADDQAGQAFEDARARERARRRARGRRRPSRRVRARAPSRRRRRRRRRRPRPDGPAASLRGGERLETGDDRAGEELLRPFGEGEVLGGAEVARDAQHRRRADRLREGGCGLERRGWRSSRARRDRRRRPRPRSPRLSSAPTSSAFSCARAASREPSTTSSPASTSRRASARPKSPVPPTIATFTRAPLPARLRRAAGARRRRS